MLDWQTGKGSWNYAYYEKVNLQWTTIVGMWGCHTVVMPSHYTLIGWQKLSLKTTILGIILSVNTEKMRILKRNPQWKGKIDANKLPNGENWSTTLKTNTIELLNTEIEYQNSPLLNRISFWCRNFLIPSAFFNSIQDRGKQKSSLAFFLCVS